MCLQNHTLEVITLIPLQIYQISFASTAWLHKPSSTSQKGKVQINDGQTDEPIKVKLMLFGAYYLEQDKKIENAWFNSFCSNKLHINTYKQACRKDIYLI